MTNDLQGGIPEEVAQLATYRYAFSSQDIDRITGSTSESKRVIKELSLDGRFVNLGDLDQNGDWFVPEKVLFGWWRSLLFRLVKAGVFALGKDQLRWSFSSLREHGEWGAMPEIAFQYGESLGFVRKGEYGFAFPLAKLISRLPKVSQEVVRTILQDFGEVEIRNRKLGCSLSRHVHSGLSAFGDRVSQTIQAREGFVVFDVGAGVAKEALTLKEIGDRQGITRERVRQIEKKFWCFFDDASGLAVEEMKAKRLPVLEGLLTEYMNGKGSVIIPASGARSALYRFVMKCNGIPVTDLPNDLGRGISIPAIRKGRKGLSEFAAFLNGADSDWIPNEDKAILRSLLSEREKQAVTKYEKAFRALRDLGTPSHFSAVHKRYLELFPDDPISEHSLHAKLTSPGPDQQQIVWIGIRGTYGLKEWGNKRPSKPLMDQVADIVRCRFEETGTPVSFDLIGKEMGDLRQVLNPNSVYIAANLNPCIKRLGNDLFVPEILQAQTVASDREDRLRLVANCQN